MIGVEGESPSADAVRGPSDVAGESPDVEAAVDQGGVLGEMVINNGTDLLGATRLEVACTDDPRLHSA